MRDRGGREGVEKERTQRQWTARGSAKFTSLCVVPEFVSFHDVHHVMERATAPALDGKPVVVMESAGDIAWRAQQRHCNSVFRNINLVIRRVTELKVQGSRVLTDAAAVAAADEERQQLGLAIPGYIRHLEARAAAKNKAAKAARTASGSSNGGSGNNSSGE